VGVKNFCTKLPKGTPVRQIWSNKSFGLCGSDVVLTPYFDEKKSTRESPLENRVVCNTTIATPDAIDVKFCIGITLTIIIIFTLGIYDPEGFGFIIIIIIIVIRIVHEVHNIKSSAN